MVTQLNAFGQTSSLHPCTASVAADRFLGTMRKAADRTYPDWHQVLKAAIEECRLPYDTRRAVLEMHPLDDYYFAGVVGMESAQIRRVFGAQDATELLAEISARVDKVAERPDRLVSSLMLDVVGSLALIMPYDHKLPHDRVVKLILKRLNIEATVATRHLLDDVLFRHHLAEPLARGVPSYWSWFKTKYKLVTHEPLADVQAIPMPTPRKPKRQLI